jgi:hypothetical protein
MPFFKMMYYLLTGEKLTGRENRFQIKELQLILSFVADHLLLYCCKEISINHRTVIKTDT